MLISIGKIGTAFNLTPNEINDLWHSPLSTRPVIKLDRLLIDPQEREIYKEFPMYDSNDCVITLKADRYAERLVWPGLRERTVEYVLEHLLEMYREREYEEGIRLEWNNLAARWRHEQFYGLIFSRLNGHVAQLQKEVHMMLKSSYVYFSCVNRDEVVQLMHNCAYPLRQEVKGLTRELYQEIIECLQATPPQEIECASAKPDEVPSKISPVESTVKELTRERQQEINECLQTPPLDEEHSLAATAYYESPPENPPTVPTIIESNPDSGQRRLPVSLLLNVIKAEADMYGLGKKNYVTSDRAIRNWLKGTTRRPLGFSAEVLFSQESIAEFAQKYIASVVAAGSSELAANAKKEVAFNPQLHGIKLETLEDAELMMEALKDVAERLPGESGLATKRRIKR